MTANLFDDLGDDWGKYNQAYDPKTKLREADKRRVIEFCKLLSHADDEQFAAGVGDYIDLDEFSRFMAVTVWLSTLDSLLTIGQNFYVYLDYRTNKFQFTPWDLDHSFGQFGIGANQEQRENLSIRHPWRGDNRFLERMFNVEAFRKLYLARMEEFSRTLFVPERFHKQVDEIAAAIRPAVKEESEAKLERFDKVVAGEPVEPAGFGPPPGPGGPRVGFGGPPGGPGAGGGPGGGPGPRFGGGGGFPFFQPVKPIKGFVGPRASSVLEQLAGKSQGIELSSGFGPFGGPPPGGPGRPEARGPGAPGGPPGRGGGFGPGMFLSGIFMNALDADKDGAVTREEFTSGFARWFDAWDLEKTGAMTEEQLRAGINQDFMKNLPPPPSP